MVRLNESRIRARAGGAVLADGFAASASVSTDWSLHAPHGAALYVGLESDVTVTDPDQRPVSGRVLLVAPDLPHAAACPGPTLSVLFDPEVASEVASYARLIGRISPLPGRLARRLGEAATSHRAWLARAEEIDGLAREAGSWLGAQAPGRSLDPRVARVLEALRDPTAEPRRIVEQAGISRAHLRALFARDVGLPIRAYQLWHRLLQAAAEFSRVDATTAAHQAGFADLAHFSRTCRRLLGDSPTGLARTLLGAQLPGAGTASGKSVAGW